MGGWRRRFVCICLSPAKTSSGQRLQANNIYRLEERGFVQAESRVELDVCLYHFCILEHTLRPHSTDVPSEVTISGVGHGKVAFGFGAGRTPLICPTEPGKLVENLVSGSNTKLLRSGSTVSFFGVTCCQKCDELTAVKDAARSST